MPSSGSLLILLLFIDPAKALPAFLAVSLIMIIIDFVIIYPKNSKTLYIGEYIYIDNISVKPKDVISIIDETTWPSRWGVSFTKLIINNNGEKLERTALGMPKWAFNSGMYNRTTETLIKKFPELTNRLKSH